MRVNGQPYRTIWLPADDPSVVRAIDQRRLPHEFALVDLRTVADVCEAIRNMTVRGAGLIGAAAGYGLYLAARAAPAARWADAVEDAARALLATRPTAANLARAVNRQRAALRGAAGREEAIARARATADAIADDDAEACRRIGEHGLALIRDAARRKPGRPVEILTHCNAGWLAFVDYGSATAPIYAAQAAGIPLHVWVDETRPRNQGANLTAWELGQQGVPHDLISDNAGGHLMQHGGVDLALTGADRVTRNGDAANKIGTYLKALAARDNGVPFYVALPSSTFDFELTDGVRTIPIEERDPDEVRSATGMTAAGAMETVRLCPDGTPARNWGFDVTPARLITKLICERGLCDASEDGIRALFPESVPGRPEGYVKYDARRTDGAIPEHPAWARLNRVRTELHDRGLIGQLPDGVGYGNVSLRTSGAQFIISGTATGGLRELSKEHYAWVESFDLEHNRVHSVGRVAASAEAMSHGAIYRAQPAAQAVIHIHSRALFDALRAARCPETDPSIPFGTPDLARAIAALLGRMDPHAGLFVTAGHAEGIFAYGDSIEAARDQIYAAWAKAGLS